MVGKWLLLPLYQIEGKGWLKTSDYNFVLKEL